MIITPARVIHVNAEKILFFINFLLKFLLLFLFIGLFITQ